MPVQQAELNTRHNCELNSRLLRTSSNGKANNSMKNKDQVKLKTTKDMASSSSNGKTNSTHSKTHSNGGKSRLLRTW